jgi:hypothetical protein
VGKMIHVRWECTDDIDETLRVVNSCYLFANSIEIILL